MTTYRRQQIPFRRWSEHVATTTDRNAIVSPLRGMICFVGDDNDLYIYDGASWVLVKNTNVPTDTLVTSTDPGRAGDMRWDTNYIYVCVATNTWKRVGISTW